MFKIFKKFLCLVVILSMGILLSACNKPKSEPTATDKTIEVEKKQWIEDIDYLKENLEKSHKNLYHKITKEDLEKQCNDLKKDLNKLSDYQIKLRLTEIVTSIGDAHTSLNVDFDEDKAVYPLGVWWFGEELKVYAADKNQKDIIGKTLVSINDIPINEVMTKINKLIPHENQQWLKVLNVRYVNMAQLLRELKITKDNESNFTFRDDKGTESSIPLTAREAELNNLITVKDSYTEKPISAQYDEKDPYWKLYWYKYIPEDKIMYFQYNQCIDRDIARNYGFDNYENLPEFSKFADGLIKELNEKEVEKFVIDLRYNTGGNSILMDNFVAKLYDVKKLRSKGKTFVMTGRQTFSSGVLACRTLKNSANAILFGEPTGGNVNGYGDIKMLTLPNSKLQASYSTKYFDLDSNYKEGFIPDVPVEQSFKNYMKGIDDVYEAVKKYGHQ